MKAHKWPLIYLSALVVLSMLVAFGMAGFSSKAASAQEGAKVTYAQWDDENGTLRHLAAIEDFNAVYPDIEIEMLPNPGGDWHSKVLTWIAAGELPDIYMADSSYIPLYVESGGLENLRPFIEGENGFDPDEIFYPGVYQNGFYQGDPYAGQDQHRSDLPNNIACAGSSARKADIAYTYHSSVDAGNNAARG